MSAVSRLAQAAALTTKQHSNTRNLFHEVCRCLPFIQRIHKLDELLTLAELRAVVKSRFLHFKAVQDPRVIELLVFKGREELECFMYMYKQRHHALNEYIEPYNQRRTTAILPTQSSAFLDSFYETPCPQIARKA